MSKSKTFNHQEIRKSYLEYQKHKKVLKKDILKSLLKIKKGDWRYSLDDGWMEFSLSFKVKDKNFNIKYLLNIMYGAEEFILYESNIEAFSCPTKDFQKKYKKHMLKIFE